jgi:hypothetical protein
MERESELGDFYADLTAAKNLLSPQLYISLVGISSGLQPLPLPLAKVLLMVSELFSSDRLRTLQQPLASRCP